ncbi:MAG: ankyrin repeat domain-containing protein [Nostoc sp.]|uniref:ankyrin repeat domain-containing protein n=1 Tax=Nostoc sp. TaxID=1180 RepID=UPI002FF67E29
MLVDAGCNVNTRKLGQDTPLTAACRIAHVKNVQALISAGANVNKVGRHDMAPLVTVFLSSRMNTALAEHGLAEKENNIVSKITQIVQALTEAGADLNVYEVNGKTALMLAGEQSYFDIVKMLIVGGANINALMQPDEQSIFVRGRNIVCKTALHLAVEAENIQAIKMLLEAGANVNIPDSEGKTPLDIAIEKNLTEIVELITYK